MAGFNIFLNLFEKIQGDAIEVVSIGTSSPKADKQINSLQYGTADVLVISYDQLKIRIEKLLKVACATSSFDVLMLAVLSTL